MSRVKNTNKHRWNNSLIIAKTKCLKCGQSAYDIIKHIEKNVPEACFCEISKNNIDIFNPCISDDEAIVKDILE